KGFAAAKRAGPADPIELCRRCRQRERRLGTVDAEDGGGRGPRRLDRKTAGIAIEVKNTRASGQTGDEAPIVALVEKPAGLLAGENRPEAIDNEAGQPVGFGMHEAIKGLIEQTLAHFESPPDAPDEKAPADRPGGVAVEEARGEQRVRVEDRDAERAGVGTLQ